MGWQGKEPTGASLWLKNNSKASSPSPVFYTNSICANRSAFLEIKPEMGLIKPITINLWSKNSLSFITYFYSGWCYELWLQSNVIHFHISLLFLKANGTRAHVTPYNSYFSPLQRKHYQLKVFEEIAKKVQVSHMLHNLLFEAVLLLLWEKTASLWQPG